MVERASQQIRNVELNGVVRLLNNTFSRYNISTGSLPNNGMWILSGFIPSIKPCFLGNTAGLLSKCP